MVRRVCERLERVYGRPRLGNPADPVDDLVFVILSNRTSPVACERAFATLKSAFPSWEMLLSAPEGVLEALLQPAGLSRVKSRQIRESLQRIRADFGTCDLESLQGRSCDLISNYLTALPGVSDKVAKCVMLYTLNCAVLPVDTHVHRIALRLGWIVEKRADQSHASLELLIPPQRRLAFHVDCVAHGRAMCTSRKPLCSACCVARHCVYYEQAATGTPGSGVW